MIFFCGRHYHFLDLLRAGVLYVWLECERASDWGQRVEPELGVQVLGIGVKAHRWLVGVCRWTVVEEVRASTIERGVDADGVGPEEIGWLSRESVARDVLA